MHCMNKIYLKIKMKINTSQNEILATTWWECSKSPAQLFLYHLQIYVYSYAAEYILLSVPHLSWLSSTKGNLSSSVSVLGGVIMPT